jgi:hypothetical protein
MAQQMRLITAFSIILLATSSSQAISQTKQCPAIESNVSDSRFKSGQVWTYTTRPNESSSTLTILQVDSSEKIGVIIHIRVDGLYAHNPRGERVPSIEHMPFTRNAMLTSADHLIRVEKQLPTLEGYERWQHDCGGVYTISVRDAVDVMEKTLNTP